VNDCSNGSHTVVFLLNLFSWRTLVCHRCLVGAWL